MIKLNFNTIKGYRISIVKGKYNGEYGTFIDANNGYCNILLNNKNNIKCRLSELEIISDIELETANILLNLKEKH